MIRVYDRFLNLLTETSSFQSLQIPLNFSGVSNFELHINRNLQGAEHFNKGNIIALDGYKAGVILTREIELNESGKESENIKVSGYTLDGLMSRRVTVPPESTSHDRRTASAEDVMKHYVNNHFFNPTDKNRRFNNLQIAPNRNRGIKVEWESRYKNVAEELERISKESGLGWRVYIDFETNQFVFDVFEKRDLTQDNLDGNNPVIFSPDFGTVKSQSFTESDNDLRNFGYVGGQGEGVDRKIIQIGNDSGWDRIETFVDARDLSEDIDQEDDRYVEDAEEDENKLSDEEYEELLNERGKKKMKEMESLLSFEAEILTPITRTSYEYSHEGYLHPAQPFGEYTPKEQTITPFEYEKDFSLGDIVSVVNKSWGIDMSAPIVEILEIHEQGGFRIEATFGESRPTITKKLKSKFDEIDNVDKDEAIYRYTKNEVEEVEEKIYETKQLWQGVYHLTDKQTVKPTKRITDCKNGWLLRWQNYSNSSSELKNDNYEYTSISKHQVNENFVNVGLSTTSGVLLTKTIYVGEYDIIGHALNNIDGRERRVITGVFEW